MTSVFGQSPHSEYFFKYEDRAGEAHFLLWHHLRHHTYDLINSRNGQTLPPLDLKGPIDKDWLLRHATRHRTLRRIAGTDAATGILGLYTTWRDHVQQADWLRIHALDHAALDRFFGVS